MSAIKNDNPETPAEVKETSVTEPTEKKKRSHKRKEPSALSNLEQKLDVVPGMTEKIADDAYQAFVEEGRPVSKLFGAEILEPINGHAAGSIENPLPDIGQDNPTPAINPFRDAVSIREMPNDRIGRFWVDIQSGTHIVFVDQVEDDAGQVRAYFDVMPGEQFSIAERIHANTMRHAPGIEALNIAHLYHMHMADALYRSMQDAQRTTLLYLRNSVSSLYRTASRLNGTPIHGDLQSYFNTSDSTIAMIRDVANFEVALSGVADKLLEYPKLSELASDAAKVKHDLQESKAREKLLLERIEQLQHTVAKSSPKDEPKSVDMDASPITKLPYFCIYDPERGFAAITEGEKYVTKCDFVEEPPDDCWYKTAESAKLVAIKARKFLEEKQALADNATKNNDKVPLPVKYEFRIMRLLIQPKVLMKPYLNVTAKLNETLAKEQDNPFELAMGGYVEPNEFEKHMPKAPAKKAPTKAPKKPAAKKTTVKVVAKKAAPKKKTSTVVAKKKTTRKK